MARLTITPLEPLSLSVVALKCTVKLKVCPLMLPCERFLYAVSPIHNTLLFCSLLDNTRCKVDASSQALSKMKDPSTKMHSYFFLARVCSYHRASSIRLPPFGPREKCNPLTSVVNSSEHLVYAQTVIRFFDVKRNDLSSVHIADFFHRVLCLRSAHSDKPGCSG